MSAGRTDLDVLRAALEGGHVPTDQQQVAAFVLKYGQTFVGRARPRGIRKGRMKQCFLNAFELVSDFDDPALIYAEGYALDRSHSSWPFLHAWCVRDGLVIEPTLKNPERYVYFGILVPRRLLFDTVEKQEHVDILTGALAKKSMAALAKLHRSPK